MTLTVHTAGVEDAKDTVRPEVAVATSANGATPNVWVPGEAKVMVCEVSGALPTVKLCVTTAAAATLALPPWLADSVQVPADTSVSVVPLTVHTPSVVDTKVTGRPELELNTSAGGGVPKAWLPGELKLMVWAAGATLKVWLTGVAADVVLLPAWVAVIVQLPAVNSVRVVPLTVHTAGVVDVSVTVRPVLALATRAGVATPRVWLPGDVKLMLCVTADTEKLRDTGVAAVKLALPGWLASTVQVPADTRVSVVPLTVHTEGVVDVKTTARPEVEVAVRASGPEPSVCESGEVKVMVCVAAETVKVLITGGAAAKTALPGWLAVMLQLPAANNVTVLPLTVQTAVVVDVNDTVRPEVALATSAGGATPRV